MFNGLMNAPKNLRDDSTPFTSISSPLTTSSAPAASPIDQTTQCVGCPRYPLERRVKCSFCDRLSCPSCVSSCSRCGLAYCALCSITVNSEVICFDCRETFFPTSKSSSSTDGSPQRRGNTIEAWEFTPTNGLRDDEPSGPSNIKQPTLEFFWKRT